MMVRSRFGRLGLAVFALSLVAASYTFYRDYQNSVQLRVYVYQPWAWDVMRLPSMGNAALEAAVVFDATESWLDPESVQMKAVHAYYSSHEYIGCDESPYNWSTCPQDQKVGLIVPMVWQTIGSGISFRCPVVTTQGVVERNTKEACTNLLGRLSGIAHQKSHEAFVNVIVKGLPFVLAVLLLPLAVLVIARLIFGWIVAVPARAK